jgi:hypothetical protein
VSVSRQTGRLGHGKIAPEHWSIKEDEMKSGDPAWLPRPEDTKRFWEAFDKLNGGRPHMKLARRKKRHEHKAKRE